MWQVQTEVNADPGELECVGLQGVVKRCTTGAPPASRSSATGPPEQLAEPLCLLEGRHRRRPRVVGPHRDEARGGVRFEASACPMMAGNTAGPTRRPWEAPRSRTFNAERRKPVVDRGELTQEVDQAIKSS